MVTGCVTWGGSYLTVVSTAGRPEEIFSVRKGMSRDSNTRILLAGVG